MATLSPMTSVDDNALEYEVRGAGDAVLFVHGGVVADWFALVAAEPALCDTYQVINYHRAGYAGSKGVAGPLSMGDQATRARQLLDRLGIERAHLVGHSSGATIALRLALDHPGTARSLALLEPALLVVPSGPFAGQAIEQFRAGNHEMAVDIWMRGIGGADYRTVLDRTLPGAFETAVADAATFFGQELPAVRDSQFGPDEAARIDAPVLAILGADSHEVSPTFGQRHELLQTWLSNVEPRVLPGVNHLMPLQAPRLVAEALAGEEVRQR
jgi:pimeloyl-ACP methyl ester carboxylesterase